MIPKIFQQTKLKPLAPCFLRLFSMFETVLQTLMDAVEAGGHTSPLLYLLSFRHLFPTPLVSRPLPSFPFPSAPLSSVVMGALYHHHHHFYLLKLCHNTRRQYTIQSVSTTYQAHTSTNGSLIVTPNKHYR